MDDPGLGGGADGSPESPKHEAPILTALSRAFHWQRLLDEDRVASGSQIARRESLHPTTVNELLRLTLLSPAIVKALLAGRQLRTLSLIWLKNHEVPADWDEQAALFGAWTIGGGSMPRRYLPLTANRCVQVVDSSGPGASVSHRSSGEKRGLEAKNGRKSGLSPLPRAPHPPAKARQY